MTDTKAYPEQQSTALLPPRAKAEIAEIVLATGDLAVLTSAERTVWYLDLCESLRLNPRSKPFMYIELDKKLTLYATKDCTDQLRKRDGVSVKIISRGREDEHYLVVAQASTQDGREDESLAAVWLMKETGEWKTTSTGKRYLDTEGCEPKPLRGDDLANAFMKCETKAKRRATLSICGLGFTDESELETIAPDRIRRVTSDPLTGDIVYANQPMQIEAPRGQPLATAQRQPERERQPVRPTAGQQAATVVHHASAPAASQPPTEAFSPEENAILEQMRSVNLPIPGPRTNETPSQRATRFDWMAARFDYRLVAIELQKIGGVAPLVGISAKVADLRADTAKMRQEIEAREALREADQGELFPEAAQSGE